MGNEQQQLLLAVNLRRQRIALNRMLLISLVNLMTLSSSLFAMVYYRWVYVSLTNSNTSQMWTNLLYVCIDNKYYTYNQASNLVCYTSQCEALFQQMSFLGGLCFSIFSLAYLMQGYDLFLFFKYLYRKYLAAKIHELRLFAINHFSRRIVAATINQITQSFPNEALASQTLETSSLSISKVAVSNFRSFGILGCYAVSLTLNFFGLSLLQAKLFLLDVGFWVVFTALIVYIFVVVYERCSLIKFNKQEKILKLIHREKILPPHNIPQEDSKSQSQFSI